MHNMPRRMVNRIDAILAWQAVQAACVGFARSDADDTLSLTSTDGRMQRAPTHFAGTVLRVHRNGQWDAALPVEEPAARMLDLYLPLVSSKPGRSHVVAHLGQSLDGRIATTTGESQFITGTENLDHVHRLRALCDAVIVGAGTVHHDDPRLTVRRCDGTNPVRVVIDTNCTLNPRFGLFQDHAAETLLCCAEDAVFDARRLPLPEREVIRIPRQGDGLRLASLVKSLAERGLFRLMVEGGGVTVSRFLAQGCLDRLHVTVAPVIIGSGRQGINLQTISSLRQSLRPVARHFIQGPDVLFDMEMRDVGVA
ncbi:MAG: RibD family protein [Pseudomonadota bacterium]|nr:RibD family protein [Pseudomonadota bacterium]